MTHNNSKTLTVYPIDEPAALFIDPYMAAYIHLAYEIKNQITDKLVPYLVSNEFDCRARTNGLPGKYTDLNSAATILKSWQVESFHLRESYVRVRSLYPDMARVPMDKLVNSTEILYVRPNLDFSPFHSPYASPDALLTEYKVRLNRCLPDSFDWWRYLCHINGTHVLAHN